jgi:crotonobetainyl-CoA:carnitine CoA-transferase CaiB-like acyl-CoA transferase
MAILIRLTSIIEIKKSITVNLKDPESIKEVKKLISQMDAIFEGFRPGVMERLGLGPSECLKINKSLVYGRMTGLGAKKDPWRINLDMILIILHFSGVFRIPWEERVKILSHL